MGWLIVLAYAYSVVDRFSSIAIWILVAAAVAATIGAVGNIIVRGEKSTTTLRNKEETKDYHSRLEENWVPWLNTLIKVGTRTFLIVGVIWALIPSQQGMKYIAGAAIVYYSADAVSNINGIEKMPEKVVTVINSLLDDIASDIKENESKSQTTMEQEVK